MATFDGEHKGKQQNELFMFLIKLEDPFSKTDNKTFCTSKFNCHFFNTFQRFTLSFYFILLGFIFFIVTSKGHSLVLKMHAGNKMNWYLTGVG